MDTQSQITLVEPMKTQDPVHPIQNLTLLSKQSCGNVIYSLRAQDKSDNRNTPTWT